MSVPQQKQQVLRALLKPESTGTTKSRPLDSDTLLSLTRQLGFPMLSASSQPPSFSRRPTRVVLDKRTESEARRTAPGNSIRGRQGTAPVASPADDQRSATRGPQRISNLLSSTRMTPCLSHGAQRGPVIGRKSVRSAIHCDTDKHPAARAHPYRLHFGPFSPLKALSTLPSSLHRRGIVPSAGRSFGLDPDDPTYNHPVFFFRTVRIGVCGWPPPVPQRAAWG